MPKSAGRWLMGVANVLSIKSDQIVLLSQGSDLLQIDHAQCRIGRRFQIKQLRVRPDRPRVLIVFRSVHKRGFDAELGQPLAEELCGAAINVTLGNHVVAAFQQGEQRCGDGSHARSKEQRGIGAFQFRNGLLGYRVRGIAVTRVKHVGGDGADLLHRCP